MQICSRFFAILLIPLVNGCGEDKTTNTEKKSPKTTSPTAPTTETSMPAPEATPSVAATVSHELADIGYVIDTPKEWEFKALGEATYTFRIKMKKTEGGPAIMPSVTIIKSPMRPQTPEAVAKHCVGTLLNSGIAENNAVFHNCEQETAGIKFLSAEYILNLGDESIICSANGLELDSMNNVCGSLRVE